MSATLNDRRERLDLLPSKETSDANLADSILVWFAKTMLLDPRRAAAIFWAEVSSRSSHPWHLGTGRFTCSSFSASLRDLALPL
jgi:hypothetical protein